MQRVGLAVSAMMVLLSANSDASHLIDSCNDFCDTNCSGQGANCVQAESGECVLSVDVECGADEGPIVLKGGTDLDMHGKKLSCASGVTCGDAIVMQAANSRVHTSDWANESLITGHFADGVDCAAQTGSMVQDIAIEDTLVGVRDCQSTVQNVIRGVGRTYLTANFGVVTQGITDTGDTIQANYFSGKLFAIQVTGTKAVRLDWNVIYTSEYGACGVQLTNSGSTVVATDNVFLGVGNAGYTTTRKVFCLPSPAPSSAVFVSNVCDKDHPDCSACTETLIGGKPTCVPLKAPFLYRYPYGYPL